MASVIAEVRSSALFRTRRMPMMEMTAGQGRHTLKCLWFHGAYLKDRFQPGQMVALYGKVEEDARSHRLQMIQPQFEILGEAEPDAPPQHAQEAARARDPGIPPQHAQEAARAGDPGGEGEDGDARKSAPANATERLPGALRHSLEVGRIVPIYEATGRLTTRWFRRVIYGALEALDAKPTPTDATATSVADADAVPAAIRQRLGLIPRREAFWRAHWPDAGESFADLQAARTPAHVRLIFEELFFLELGLELKRRRMRGRSGIGFAIDERVRQALKHILPFHPTAAQKRVLKEIAGDMRQPAPMRRLLQGDVGSGKTIVAFEAAIIAIENGYQVAMMAPTEILAAQHYFSARRILEKAGYRIVLLTGSVEQGRKSRHPAPHRPGQCAAGDRHPCPAGRECAIREAGPGDRR